jgi:hypothetical protein
MPWPESLRPFKLIPLPSFNRVPLWTRLIANLAADGCGRRVPTIRLAHMSTDWGHSGTNVPLDSTGLVGGHNPVYSWGLGYKITDGNLAVHEHGEEPVAELGELMVFDVIDTGSIPKWENDSLKHEEQILRRACEFEFPHPLPIGSWHF